MANNALTRAEQAGKDYFRDHQDSNHREAERHARKAYASVIERDCFVAGWNIAFWDEQARVLKSTKVRA